MTKNRSAAAAESTADPATTETKTQFKASCGCGWQLAHETPEVTLKEAREHSYRNRHTVVLSGTTRFAS